MSCDMGYFRRQELRNEITSAVKDDVNALEEKLSNDLSNIAEKIFARLDVMEQAIADPDGEAAASLRKKHGLGKQGPVIPLGKVSKKPGA